MRYRPVKGHPWWDQVSAQTLSHIVHFESNFHIEFTRSFVVITCSFRKRSCGNTLLRKFCTIIRLLFLYEYAFFTLLVY